MKRWIIYILSFVLAFSLIPVLLIGNNSRINATTPEQSSSNDSSSSAPQLPQPNSTPSTESSDEPSSQSQSGSDSPEESQSSTPPQTLQTLSDSIVLYDISTGENITVSYLDYMIGAVAAEMPADFEEEAMKAQALASLSYALYYRENFPAQSLTCDTANNKGYMDRDAMSDFWGMRYMEYYLKISGACNEVLNEAILYDGRPIAAAYHASSAVATAASEQVWTQSLPYLRSVATVEAYNITTSAFTVEEAISIIVTDNDSAAFPNDISTLFSDIYYFENGYIDTVNIAGKLYTGEQFRTLFSLRSSACEIQFENDTFTFETIGYGHGVGLSQEGAQTLAENGYDYRYILQYYYTDVTIDDYY